MDFSSNTTEPMLDLGKILVIDDEKLVRQSIAIYLEDSGYYVTEAEDGIQGLKLFDELRLT